MVAITVFHCEAGSVQCHTQASPGYIVRLHIQDGLLLVAHGHQGRWRGLGGIHHLRGLLGTAAQFDHQTTQKLSFQARVAGTRLPDDGSFGDVSVDLNHAAVGDADFGAVRRQGFDPGAVFVALAGGEQAIHELTQGSAQKVLGQLGAVLGPFGFQQTDSGLFGGVGEPVFYPELAHQGPHLVRRTLDHQPALGTAALDTHIGDLGGCREACGCAALLLQGGRTDGAAGHGVA